MGLRKERFEHDIPQLMTGGIPVLTKNYVAIEISIRKAIKGRSMTAATYF